MLEKLLNSHKVLLTILFFTISFGLYSYQSLPREADPDISLPIIYVSLAHQGISPEDSERLLIKPLEKELKNIEGVKKMSSTSYLGGGNLVLEFDAGFQSEKALNDVRVKVDFVKSKLPQETKEPIVSEVNLSRFPVLAIAVSGKIEKRALLEVSKELKSKIEELSQILEVKIIGENERQIEINVDPKTVKAYGLTAKEVIVSLRSSNILIPAGKLSSETGSFNIKVPSLFENVRDILDLPIKSNNISVVKLGDIAEIKDSYKEILGYARNNGENAIILEVSKRTGENIIETIELVKKTVIDSTNLLPSKVKINFFQDESKAIHSMISDLENNVILAILLVLIIIMFQMGWKSAILVSLSIPGSFLISMVFLSFIGVTINIVVLFSLILSVGILIDGAIIVVEYANRRAAEGLDAKNVFLVSSRKMFTPVLASTLTTLAAFFPLIFWPGIAGEFMFYLPVTLLVILSSSLLMALIFIPVLGNIFGSDSHRAKNQSKNLKLLEFGNLNEIGGIQGVYINILTWCLKSPIKIIFFTIFILIFIQSIYSKFGKGLEYFPEIEPDYAEVIVHARGNLSINDMDIIMTKVEAIILNNRFIQNSYTKIGAVKGKKNQGSDDVVGSINIEFIEWKLRPSTDLIIKKLENECNKIPGIIVEILEKKDGPPNEKDIEIEITNINKMDLMNDSLFINNYLTTQSWVKNLNDGMNAPGIEWELKIDRSKAEKNGIEIQTIGDAIQMVTHGLKITDFMPEDSNKEIDIVVKFSDEYRNLNELDKIEIKGKNGLVALNNFVIRKARPKVGEINRTDSINSINIMFDVSSDLNVNKKVNQLKNWLETKNSKLKSTIKFRGQEEEQDEAKEFLIKAFFIAIFLILLILITTFESFYFCFIILTSVIMSTIGVMIGLLLTGQAFGIVMSGIGVIALAGIVVNNNIVLLDTYRNLRKLNANTNEVIIRTGVQRLRPILLTTLTTFFGLIPMASGISLNFTTLELSINSPSSQWWLQLSNAMVFGIIFSFVLTLIVTPCLISVGEKLRKEVKDYFFS